MRAFHLPDLPVRDRYQLLTRLAAPRPIALVSTLGADGGGNLAPFSYFNVGGANPASCMICPVFDRSGQAKDTLRNIEATGEYVVNIVSHAMVARVSQSSWSYPPEVDELDAVGFTRLPSVHVAPPRVAESPAHLECRVFQIVAHGDGPLASRYIIGEVVHIHVADAALTDGWPDNHKLDQVGRCGADLYTRTTAGLFALERPKGP